MILQREITEVAERLRVSKSTVDKDWVLGHFVNSLFLDDSLKDRLIFKGGTCLRKCYFENYRFSEDLDFTVLDSSFVFTPELLTRVCRQVEAISGIHTFIQSLRPMAFDGLLTGFQADIKFWGADHSRNQAPLPPERWQTRLKIELILFEEMYFDVVNRPLFHPYSDNEQVMASPRCYAIEEVLAEKLRAIIQRKYTAPRDYYDIWFLHKHIPDLNWEAIVTAFHRKMALKSLSYDGPSQFSSAKQHKTLNAHWNQSLAHQLSVEQFPALSTVLTDLNDLFSTIF